MKMCLAVTALIALSGSTLAQEQPVRIMPDELAWKDAPALPKGAQVAILIGDPTKAGSVVVQRVKFPPNYQVPPHTHPYSEVVTLISGKIGSRHGDKFEKTGEMMEPGAFWVYPAKHSHYAWTEGGEAIIQVQFIGPGAIDYINHADDPRKK
jgi:quercetin dioxygenase-like cupin family protein